MATLPGDVPKPRLRPKAQQTPNLRDPATVPAPDVLGNGNTDVNPRPRPTIDLGATGNTDFTPRLREDIPVPTEANLYGADALSSQPPELAALAEAATPQDPPDIIKDQALADAKKANPDVQFAPGVTGDMIFRTQTRANERTIAADKLTGFAPRPDFRTPLGMASNDSVDLTRAKLERLNGTRPDSWMYDAHIASKVQGGSDAPPTVGPDGTYDDFLKNRYAGITNDQALDGLMRQKFDELAKVNPIAAANGTNIGDTWRTVQALGSDASVAPSPKPPSDPLMDAGQAAHDAVFGALGSAGDVANELLGIKSAKGQTAAPAKPAMTPEQAMQYLTGSNKAAPPPTKGPLDVMWEVAGNATKTVAANSFDAVTNLPKGAYLGVKAALDGIDGITSGIAGYAGDKTGIEFLKEYAQGGLGLPELPDARTPAGQVSRGVAEFMTGYYFGGKALELVGWAGGGATVAQGARTLAQGAIADAGFFDGQSGKLSDLLVQVPGLQNPVTQFLASNPNDGEAEGRFKNALNGILAAPLVPAFVAVVRGLKTGVVAFRSVPRDVPNMQGGEANPFTTPLPAAQKSLLGNAAADAPVSVPAVVDPITGKLAVAAAEVEAAGLTPIGDAAAGGPQVFANFAAIKTPDDLQGIANNLIAAYEGTTDAARQGIVTNAQTKAAAGSIDAFDTLLSRKTGDAPNAAQVYAWKSLYLGSLSKLQEVAKAASTASLTDAPAALLQMREMESVVLAVQKEFYGARAESGRALQAFKIPPDSVFAAKQVQNLLNAYGGIDANVDLARKLAAIDDPKALADFVESTVFTKSKDAWQQFYYASILSSPKTHIRNFVGNTVMMGMNMAETGLASQFSAAMGSDAVKGGEAIANWTGIKMAFGDALQAASRTWKTGESTGGYGLNKVDFPQRNAISATTWNLAPTSTFGRAVDALGAVTMIPSRLLSSSDEFFKTVGASGTGYQMAFRQAQNEVAKGTLQPDQVADRVTQLVSDFPNRLDDATKAAVADKAAYLTFTTPPKQGGWVDLLLKIRAVGDQPDASLISKAGGLAARTVIPFVNTPANIMLATFERTPLAPLTARYRDAMAEGGAAAYTANAKMALGTMSMATWTDMAMNGQVTGQGPPANSAEYQVLYATGWRPYSVKMGDHYVSYQGLEPLSTVLGWSATIGEMMSNADTTADPTAQANIEKAVAATVFALGDVVLSKTYLSSSADLLDAINSGNPTSAEYFIKKYGAGMLVPNIVKDANTIVDPAQKYTTSILDEAKSRIPGLSADMPPRRDAFGFVKSYQSGFGSAYDAISPFFASQVKDLPVASAMLKDGWAISTPPMAFSIDGQRVDVSNQPAVYSRFLELRGQVKPSDLTDRVTPNFTAADRYASGDAAVAWAERLKDRYGDRSMTDALNSIVSEAPPQDLRDMAEKYHSFTNADDRRKFILNIVSDYQDAAKAVLFSEYPQLPARAAQLKAAGQEAQP